jgi:hypothetical protein
LGIKKFTGIWNCILLLIQLTENSKNYILAFLD